MSECYPQQNSPGASCGADKLVCITLEELLQRNPQARMSDLPTGTRVLVNAQYWVTVGKDSPQGESGVGTQQNIKKMEKTPPDGKDSERITEIKRLQEERAAVEACLLIVRKAENMLSEGSRVTDDEWQMA
ncbi:hypothetical protein HCBG_07265 [Histoplasma capsulatum G186AR]|uniref:Uncharacterized protein n=2 Tax=Ajellomyces capsulatus TaxID=5037 RepID=C0NVT5_AJECG|nr:uncharacterized protein HCBG_07265 [Histoplasma capsulatum G186AR]EEH04624.1 hypothetical protein HCBG_07265 [Histoplasma capsulatum G186AR]KAG5296457.1 hypothetical protein I7I52_07149 [Histoplasma capsulatum]QSS74440.1 hypothetical protein I7I50_09619 [Histoplasma capsulatum G186AR]